VVKAGDVVKVKVLEVDLQRKRIALTMRMGDEAAPAARNSGRDNAPRGGRPKGGKPAQQAPAPAGGAMADALARALKR